MADRTIRRIVVGMFWSALAAVVVLLLAGVCLADQWRVFLDAVRQAESGGNDVAVGDGGKAIGPYQIWRVYWRDALEHAPELGGVYEDCFDFAYAEFVMMAYWSRHCPRAVETRDWERLARVHNGGCKGWRSKAALAYWRRVERTMKGDVQ